MVAITRPGRSIRRAFHYNENKYQEGKATFLSAENYPLPADEISSHQRVNMLLKTAAIKPEVKVNSLHISLNFNPSEQLSDEQMLAVTRAYMDRIGFGQQPYLVYRHHDSGHPHCHIVTTNVCLDGTSISLHYIGKKRSEPARKEVEQIFNLVRAGDQGRKLFTMQPVDAQVIQYGKTETRRAIANVLGKVIGGYKYSSLPELNAVLRLYNIEAYGGQEGSRTRRHDGLLYRILDSEGSPVGVPIKASLFHNKPTLKVLEQRFLANDLARQPHKNKLKTTIDLALLQNGGSFEGWLQALKAEGVRTVCRFSKEGQLYGLTYVDMRTRCVFNGSALGKGYSAKAILEKCAATLGQEPDGASYHHKTGTGKDLGTSQTASHLQNTHYDQETFQKGRSMEDTAVIELLTRYEYASNAVPYQWRKKKKKKKRIIR